MVLIHRCVQKENQCVISLQPNGDSLGQVSRNVRISYFEARSQLQILGPCDGLICITNYETIVMCNPMLQKFYLLPTRSFPCPHGSRPMELGLGLEFGFDPCTNATKFLEYWIL